MFNTKIRDNIAAAEAPSSGKSILEYAPSCGASEDFRTLAKEIMERFNGQPRVHKRTRFSFISRGIKM